MSEIDWEHVEDVSDQATGEAHRIKLSEPVEVEQTVGDSVRTETAYFIVSATHAPFGGPETYAFPAKEEGEPTSWGEVISAGDGLVSQKGTLDWKLVADALVKAANGPGLKA